jgi:outer membrane biosynthesis protein TonB
VLLVLGGALFTVLLIGVSVALAVFVLREARTPQQNAAVPPPPAAAAEVPVPAINTDENEVETPPEGEVAPLKVATAVEVPKPKPKPKPAPSQPAREEAMVVTPVPVVSEARYEPYIPKPAESAAREESAPVPDDIRTLPMLSRSDRAQYRLEGMTINMLNEASPTRPLGNALINLEKIFIGETLPGSNATLIDVKSHGIAIEIMSTRQRYYLPR